MIKRVIPFRKQEFMDSMCGYIESYEFYNEGIIKELEDKVSEYCGMKYALCVNSGTSALYMSLYIKSQMETGTVLKNEVILPNYGFPAAWKVCQVLNLVPIAVDLERETMSMPYEQVLQYISKWTMAIVHVETNGIVGNAQTFKGILPEDAIYIEDSAPSMIQTYKGIPAGSFGDVSVYSFSPTKPMCAGEGAVILTDRVDLYNELKTLRHNLYNSEDPSLNFNMSPFSAAYLIPQIDSLHEVAEMREWVHSEYKKHLDIYEQEGSTNRYGAIMYLSSKAEQIHEKLNEFDVEHRYKYYPLYNDGHSISKQIRDEIIDLPMHHELTSKQIYFICNLIKRCENE